MLDNILDPIGVTCYFCCGEEFVGDTGITIVCRRLEQLVLQIQIRHLLIMILQLHIDSHREYAWHLTMVARGSWKDGVTWSLD